MADQGQQSSPEKSLGNSISDARTSYDRIKRVRFIGNVVQTGVRFLFGGIGVPFLVTILFVGGVTFGLLFLNPNVVSGGTPGTPGADCIADLGGSCDIGTCASPNVPDTTGATCTDTTKICCVAPKACTDPSVGGQCSADSSCASVTPVSTPDTTGATCSDTTKPTCCVPEKTCDSISGKCSPDATCASVTPPSIPDTTHAVCTPKTDTCCVSETDCSAYLSTPVAGLKNIFNIVPSGGSTSDYSSLFKFFCDAARSSGYKSALTAGGNTLRIELNAPGLDSCSGLTPWGQNLIQFGPWTCGVNQGNLEHLVIHESGHVIAYRNTVYQRYPYSQLLNSDSSCYNGGYIASYPLSGSCSGSPLINAKNESFAESIGEYVTYKISGSQGQCAVAIPNFPTKCLNTYSWFNNNVFGGYNY